ncbi:MAG: HK97 family phage prohead protease, partial [Bacteroidota bacterium]
MPQKEIRIANTDFELREEDEEKKIVGYAALFNSPAEETNGFIEKIAPGAFANAIKRSDTRALINHNAEKILGRKKAGTLTLREDEKGLFYEVDPPDTTYANDLMESMKRGDIDQSSFGFVVAAEEWNESGDVPVRTIVEVDELFDVSPVTFPWYENTESGLKSRAK